jgi:hypothetical protein
MEFGRRGSGWIAELLKVCNDMGGHVYGLIARRTTHERLRTYGHIMSLGKLEFLLCQRVMEVTRASRSARSTRTLRLILQLIDLKLQIAEFTPFLI